VDFESGLTVSTVRDLLRSPAISTGAHDPSMLVATPAASSAAPSADSSSDATPRSVLLSTLLRAAADAAAAGDPTAARIAYEAAGKVLSAKQAPGAAVVDLADERRKRGER
jgi:hypothetical protein